MTNTQAAERQAKRECMREQLIDALRHTANTLRIACIAITDPEARRMALAVVKQAEAAIADAKEQQQ